MFRCLHRLATAALAAAVVSAPAQTIAPAASALASAPLSSKPAPQLRTPAELRDSASAAGDLRPEQHVTPQIVIPLRKASPPTTTRHGAIQRGVAAPSAGIDDAVARCEAQSSAPARETCRANRPKKAPGQAAMTLHVQPALRTGV